MATIADLTAAVQSLSAAVETLLRAQSGATTGTFLTAEDQAALDAAVEKLSSEVATVSGAAAQVPPPPAAAPAGT